ncbi:MULTISPECIES: serine hydrolase domain-containing protein [Streptomyces]|uniref:serine hydrolase domain-containing protein n=1 Tax=Streptomyces TaxID=1883 RepID=UPI00089B2F96|nr:MULTISPECIES: serine hydrolase domain-containing protein [unclassified Streptomyces]SEC65249.1 CubicO group peptidase, beta-lactamase class C family [Streptomyces sp. PAN_FS17]SED14177.1 CubicO group peptidase, beta-lactamase class C family [Streptomyces sp. KS_5]
MDVNGTVAEGFEPVRDAFVRNFETLGERGAAIAVYRDGRKVVDLWAGTKDVDGTEPWQRGTAQVVRSATKGVAAAVLLALWQRGRLDLDAPVAEYWPEFKARGKERVLVRQVLNHRAGLPVLDRPLTPQESLDPLRGPEAVAAQAPVWEPGTEHGYHALTYGWMLDGIVRRVTGKGTGEWIADEIAGPLGAELWLGLPAAEEAAGRAGRVGRVEAPEPASGAVLKARPKRSVTDAYTDPDSLTRRAFAAITPFPDQNDPAYRASALPATNGIATADGLARVYAALIGEVDGVRLLDAATVERARAEESSGPDRVLVVNTRFGLGYMLHGTASPLLGPGSFGHPGRGGALGFADPEAGIALGYVTNGFRKTVTADPRAQGLIRALRASLAG